ncbi:MAG: glycosyl hydrolase family 28 protein [Cytophagales bacterium]|nr:glycosyl hydrolase family 28 protein [Cytophagales bacterium]MDW8383602.1 glycosyl hydrolase family 28 protein [Flammeovirgaceae bacterium]
MWKWEIAFFSAIGLLSCNPKTESLKILYATEIGAVADGRTLNTNILQKAIDQLAAFGGGKLILDAPGQFLSGTLFLKNNVALQIQAGATLLGSPSIEDYTPLTQGHNADRQPYHLIVAQEAENISIIGEGIIDGNGKHFWREDNEKDAQGNFVEPRWIMPKDKKVSPLIELVRCKNVFIENITVKTGGGWNIHLHDCQRVKITGVRIDNSLFSPNSDGIDITGGNDITISDCYIRTCDDGICLKTLTESQPCRRVTVTNCIIQTSCVALKLGCNESFKDISDIAFSNCVIDKSSRAIGLYTKEGGNYENISINNIVANTNAPFVLNRPIQIMAEKPKDNRLPGSVRNIQISNFQCKTQGRILLTAQEGTLIENISFRDIMLEYAYQENPIPYIEGIKSNQYPKAEHNLEARGATGAIVAENIRNLVVENILITWAKDTIPADWKHPERIENGGKRIFRLSYESSREADYPVIWAKNVHGGYIRAFLAKASASHVTPFVLKNSTLSVLK